MARRIQKAEAPGVLARLDSQFEQYGSLLKELNRDLANNKRALRRKKTSELMRNRQSIMTSIRTLMAGQQALLMNYHKIVKAEAGNKGGDTLVRVTKLPARPDPVKREIEPFDAGTD